MFRKGDILALVSLISNQRIPYLAVAFIKTYGLIKLRYHYSVKYKYDYTDMLLPSPNCLRCHLYGWM